MRCPKSLLYYPCSFYVAVALRAILFVYGEWQDRSLDVPFTDVDYYVLEDASLYCCQCPNRGFNASTDFSPYRRSTFRYTPLLAYLMMPNRWVGWQGFGKLVFVLLDLLAGYLLVQLARARHGVDSTQIEPGTVADRYSGPPARLLCLAAGDNNRALRASELAITLLWLWNPVVFTISTRGNAESLVCTLVLSFFYFLARDQIAAAALCFGLAVHLKIFPILYVWPLFFWLKNQERRRRSEAQQRVYFGLPWAFVQFGLLSGAVFTGLFFTFYFLYGNAFVYETYLHHLVRQDHRHNFSIYFYYFYLHESIAQPLAARLAAFFPQALLALLFGWRFYRDLPFACFLLTFTFVAYNKVCTSQYFLWYVCLLPMVLYWNPIQLRTGLWMLALWLGAQGIWLHTAYRLEFLGLSHYFQLWLASVAFFIVNILIAGEWVQAHTRSYLRAPERPA